jgi:hypothetical protein
MTKYVNYQKPTRSLKERLEPHPIWRGIGLIMAVVLPIMAYLLVADALSNPAKYPWFSIPSELIINQLWDPMILIKIIFTLILVLAMFVVIGFFTFVMYSMFGRK